jgi:hypothetical protein
MGSSHTLNVDSPESPYSVNTEYLFSSWSDGGAQSHTISSLPATSTAYTATMVPQYAPATNFGFPPCGGTAAITPSSTEGGFYPWGTQLTYTATPGTGWTFAGWTYDLSGAANPATLTATDETLVYANFNTTNAPLTLTGLSPSSVAAGSSSFTLTLTGTGFVPTSESNVNVNVGGMYLTPTFVNAGEMQVTVPSTLVATAGTFDVYVENFPLNSSGCAVFAYDTFAVTAAGSGATAPTINWTPAAEIVSGDAGAGVLNAITTPAPIGNFSYSATPTGGGSAINVTAGTSGLAPGTYTITATFNPINPQYAPATVNNSLTVAGETVWILNSGGSLSELTGDGTALSPSAFAGANIGLGIDGGGNVWSIGNGLSPIEESNQVGVQLSPIQPNGGLGTPAGIAIDGDNQVWVTNNNGSVSLFANSGAALSPSTGFTDSSLSTPTGIAIDAGGSVWIANQGNNSVTRILGAAGPVVPPATVAPTPSVSVSCYEGSGAYTLTTGAINTTGANAVAVALSSFPGSISVTHSVGSDGNATPLTAADANSPSNQFFYWQNPSTGTNDTFTVTTGTAPGLYGTACVFVMSGISGLYSGVQNSTAAGYQSSTCQPGSITPSGSNQVVLTAFGTYTPSGAPTIDSSYTTPVYNPGAGGTAFGEAASYLIQTTGMATNPTWTWPSSASTPACISAAFH